MSRQSVNVLFCMSFPGGKTAVNRREVVAEEVNIIMVQAAPNGKAKVDLEVGIGNDAGMIKTLETKETGRKGVSLHRPLHLLIHPLHHRRENLQNRRLPKNSQVRHHLRLQNCPPQRFWHVLKVKPTSTLCTTCVDQELFETNLFNSLV